GQGEDEPERGVRGRFERRGRVGGDPGEERLRAVALELALHQSARRAEGEQPEPRERERRARHVQDGTEYLPDDGIPIAYEWSEEATVSTGVGPERGGRLVDVAREDRRRRVVERVGERDLRVDPFESVA